MYIQNQEQFIKENPIDSLNIEQAKEIYNKLVDDLNYHNFLYYVKSQPIISDYEYDLLFHYLKDLEKKFPQFIRKDSPTQRLTNQIQSELKKAKHKYPLLSLENTYNPEEVEEKLNKLMEEVKIYKLKDKKIKTKSSDNHQNKSSEISFYIEPKYDGLSIELIYENGYFQQAITRGDGFVGEDVTENAKTIRTLPLKIPYKGKLHVRGEVVVRKSIFAKINNEQEKKGLENYSNPRNLASGSLRQLDASITAKRKLDVVCYEILNRIGKDLGTDFGQKEKEIGKDLGTDFGQKEKGIGKDLGTDFGQKEKEVNFKTHTESLDFLEKQGFLIFDLKTIGEFKERHGLNKEQILEVVKSQEIKNLLDKQDIEFDGLVIKVNEVKYWPLIGNTSHHPKWAFAFKYPAKQISTQILDIELSVGRTGVITPVAILQPVDFSGVTVQKASLHNFDFIKEKDIHIGDYVFVQRSGEVIPYVVGVIKERRNLENSITGLEQDYQDKSNLEKLIENYKKEFLSPETDYNSYLDYIKKYSIDNLIEYGHLIKIVEPSYCPVCEGETFHPEGEVALRCINVACPAQIKEKISYFVSKNGLDIEGLSEKTIEVLLKIGLIKDYGDIFTLKEKRQQLLALPGFKEKKVENILNSIEEKRQIPLNIFLQALGIEFVGKKTAKLIIEALEINRFKKDEDGYLDFNKIVDFLLSEKGEEFLLSINGIGPKVVQSIKKFFHEKHNQKVIEKLLKYIKIKFDTTKQGKFSGQSFVITGSIPGISRDMIEKFIEENGGEFSNQVTKETSLLLVGEKAGNTKIKKAQEYGILTYDLYKFLKENGFTFPENTKVQESLF